MESALLKLVAREEDANPNDLEKVVDRVIRKASKRQSWAAEQADLVRKGVMELVHERRCTINAEIQEEPSGADIYSYRIAGKLLGDLTGDELLPLADAEENRAMRLHVKARLLEVLVEAQKEGIEKMVRRRQRRRQLQR